MRTTIFKKVLNSVLAVSIATTGFVIPTPKYFVHAEEVAVQKVVLSEGFDNYINEMPSGWLEENAYGQRPNYNNISNSGLAAPSVKLGSNGQTLTTPMFVLDNVGTLSFVAKGNGNNGDFSSELVVKVLNNGIWETILSEVISQDKQTLTFELAQTVTQVQFMINKVVGNVMIDDVKVTTTSTSTDAELPSEPTPDVVPLEGLVLTGASKLAVGVESTLKVEYQPENTTQTEVTYASTDENVITVTPEGKITTHAEGRSMLTATSTANPSLVAEKLIIVENTPVVEEIVVFDEVFSSFPTLADGWSTNVTETYSGPALKMNQKDHFIQTQEFGLGDTAKFYLTVKGNSSQASGTTVLAVQYQSDYGTTWHTLAEISEITGSAVKHELEVPANATRLQVVVTTKGQMNVSLDDLKLVATSLKDKEPDTELPVIEHTALAEGNLDYDLVVKANVSDNRKLAKVTLNYRVAGTEKFRTIEMALVDGLYEGTISKSDLSTDGMEYYIEAVDAEGNKAQTDTYQVKISDLDKVAPLITSLSPADNANLGKNKTPKISAKYSDRSGINTESVKLFLNGEEVTKKATITETEVTYQVEKELENGTYSIKLQLEDKVGNAVEKEWSFKVADVARNLYFGQLHSHTNLSDGQGTIDEAYTYAKNQAKVDFLAVTDHSNSFDNDTQASIADGSMSTKWNTGLAAADKYNEDGVFTALYAYEMTWSAGTGKYGHMNTFNTPGFETRTNAAMDLKSYYNALKTQEQSVSQFNHPGTTFGDFVDFGFYDEQVDELITLIEVGNGDGPIRGSGHFPSYEYYTRALDKGWHVAPTNNQDNHKGLWGNANTARTVIEAEELTRESLYEAIRERRVYSTEDENLEISYELNGATMGSILSEQSEANVVVTVLDPDAGDTIDKIQLITDGGRVAHEVTNVNATEKEWKLTFTPDASSTYYYVKVVQGDKDIAVTAPVWIREKENVGISNVEASSSKLLVGDEVTVETVVFNNESKAITNAKVEYYVNGSTEAVATDSLAMIEASNNGSLKATFPITKKGKNVIEAVLTLTINGAVREYTERIEITAFDSSEVSHVLIDGSKMNGYVTGNYAGNMNYVTELVGQEGGVVKINTETITSEILTGINVLIITDPENDFVYSNEEVVAIKAFVEAGGDLIVTSKADYKDQTGQFGNAAQGNKVLEAIGATIRFNDDQVVDPVENGGQAYRLYFDDYNEESPYTKGIDFGKIEQGNSKNTDYKFSFYSGNSVLVPADATNVDVVVKGHETTTNDDADKQGDYTPLNPGDMVALAVETLPNGSKVVASGVTFFSDFEMNPKNDYSNRTIVTNLINDLAPAKEAQITPIKELHTDLDGDNMPDLAGETRTIEGYVTAGNSNSKTTFFDVIYVQDETGGITIHPISNLKLKLGQKVRITGVVGAYEGDTQLGNVNEALDVEILDESINLVKPTFMSTADSMLEETEGLLVAVKGTVTRIDTEKGNIFVNDGSGEARVFINGYIGGSKVDEIDSWKSRISVGDTLYAVGLSAEDPEGSRIRVRDTDELVVIDDETPEIPNPEVPEYSIPDSILGAINTAVIKPMTGNGSVESPLMLNASSATLTDVEEMINGFQGYTVKVTLLAEASNEFQYSIQLIPNTRSGETISLILTVSKSQTEVVNYLNSLINTSGGGSNSGGNHSGNTDGSNNNSNDNSTNHSTTSNPSTGKPETGYQVMGWMLGGIAFIVAGYVAYVIYNKRQKEVK